MNKKQKRFYSCWLAISLIFSVSTVTFAQENSEDSVDDSEYLDDDIYILSDYVITGTLIRGVVPVGSASIDVEIDAIDATAASSGSEILATLPQVSNFFNEIPTKTLTTPNAVQVARPILRDLPGAGLASGASTLVLIDGQRVASVGVTQSAIDPDIVPMGALERVEIMPDGASSLYGADGIGGVINFITRRSFDGVKIDGSYGVADGYYNTDFNIIVGDDWGKGSAYVSYSYSANSDILGKDRDWIRRMDYTGDTPVPQSIETSLPNVATPDVQIYLPAYNFWLTIAEGTNYPMTGVGTYGAAGEYNREDALNEVSVIPSIERHGLYGSFYQEISENFKVDVRAFYSVRDSESANGSGSGNVAIAADNPNYVEISDAPGVDHNVFFSFAPLWGYDALVGSTHYDVFGMSVTGTLEINDNWQLKTLVNYSKSASEYENQDLNPTLLAGYATSGDINPYNIAASSNVSAAREIANWALAGESGDELATFRSILDGTLFQLPAGGVKVAIGYEYMNDDYKQRYGTQKIGALSQLNFSNYSRDTHSGFGELSIPLVNSDSDITGVYALDLSISARYDKYSDFGSTFNPKYGLTYKPAEWISFRGNWGTSFNAPTPVDQLGSLRNTIGAYPFVAAAKPGDTPPAGAYTIALLGSNNDLQPQEADTWSVGADFEVPFVEGLNVSVTYYNIFFKGILNRAPVFNAQQLFDYYPDFVVLNPTAEQISEFASYAANTGGPAVVEPYLDGSPVVYELIDYRLSNLGNSKLDGLDFAMMYAKQTGFGGFDASITGTFNLSRDTQLSDAAPFTDDYETGASLFHVMIALGVDVNGIFMEKSAFRAEARLKHNEGYKVLRTAALPQDNVGDFNTVDLYFRYDFNGTGYLEDISLSLNVKNVLDEEPPLNKATGGDGYTNGFSLGRQIIMGVSKRF